MCSCTCIQCSINRNLLSICCVPDTFGFQDTAENKAESQHSIEHSLIERSIQNRILKQSNNKRI